MRHHMRYLLGHVARSSRARPMAPKGALAAGSVLLLSGKAACAEEDAAPASWCRNVGVGVAGVAVVGLAAVAVLKLGDGTQAAAATPQKSRIAVDSEAQRCYEQGQKVQQEGGTRALREAHQFYLKAADAGHPEAQRTLGWHYRHGKGVKRDYTEALRRYEQAAQQGHAQAQYELAVLHMSGLGTPRNAEKAHRWAQLAAEQGYAAALNGLEGIDPRYEELMERAADPNVGLPKRVGGDGIDTVEEVARNVPGHGGFVTALYSKDSQKTVFVDKSGK